MSEIEAVKHGLNQINEFLRIDEHKKNGVESLEAL